MWIECGFPPDAFWHQSPQTFQLAMQGVRKRLRAEADSDLANAWQTAAFSGAAGAGKLKPLKHYLRQPTKAQTPAEMFAAIQAIQAAGANMTIRRIGSPTSGENAAANEQGAGDHNAHESDR